MIVLSRGLPSPLPGASDAENAELEQRWAEWQRELVARSTHARHRIAARSAHHIQLSEPELVVDAIRELTGKTAGR